MRGRQEEDRPVFDKQPEVSDFGFTHETAFGLERFVIGVRAAPHAGGLVEQVTFFGV